MNAKKIGIGILVAILIAVSFYFFYWTKTPQYSLVQIQKAIQNHDIDTFEKHVDLDSLYSKVVDDFIVEGMKKEKGGLDQTLAAGFIQLFKPTMVSMLKDATVENIKGNKKDSEKGKASSKTGSGSNEIVSELKDKSNVSNLSIKDTTVISQEGNIANVKIKVHDKELNKDFDLKIKMSKLESGQWRLKEILNLIEYLQEVDKATKEAEKEAAEKKRKQIQEKEKSLKEAINKEIAQKLNDKNRKGIINGKDVLMRSGPGRQYDSIGTFNKGETVSILSENSEWLNVETTNKRNVWVHKQYCSEFFGERNLPLKIILHRAVPNEMNVAILDCTVSPKVDMKLFEKADESSKAVINIEKDKKYPVIDFELHTYPQQNSYGLDPKSAMYVLSYRGEGVYSVLTKGNIEHVSLNRNDIEMNAHPDFWLRLKVSDSSGWVKITDVKNNWNTNKFNGVFWEDKNKALKLVPGSNNIKNTNSGESTNKISLDKDVLISHKDGIDFYIGKTITSGTSSTGKYFKVTIKQVQNGKTIKSNEWSFSKWRDDSWRYRTDEMKGNTSIVYENKTFEFCMKQLGWAYEKANGYYR